MVTSDTIEGRINEVYSYHYDVFSDVLYIRKISSRGKFAVGEETDAGYIVFRDEEENFIGVTIIDWWHHFGRGNVNGSTLSSFIACIEEQALPLLAA